MIYGELLPHEEQEVIESPDGDPLKQGTITAAVSIGCPIGPIQPIPAPVDHPMRRTEESPLVATRKTDLLIAHDLPGALHGLYDSYQGVRDTVDAIHESERKKR